MYASVRRYQADPEAIAEVIRRARDDFVPIVRYIPGFVGYYVIDAGDGVAVSISIFDSEEAALQSNQNAADWVKGNLSALLPNPPEITAGPVAVHAP